MFLSPPVNIPPTRFALKARRVFIGLLAMQGVLTVCRFFIMDLWGATLNLFVVVMGTFVVSSVGGMDATFCLYYGLMCLVNGIFDIILCLERWMHVKYPLFARDAPAMYNIASAIFLLCPAVEMAAAVLAAYVHMDAQEVESHMVLPRYAATAADFAAVREDLQAAAQGRPVSLRGEGFMPFCGRGHHL